MTPVEWQPRRVVVTGYYDGPTEGIIDFGEGVGVYCFKAVAFDYDRGTRVLKLSRVAAGQLESILETLSSALGPPRWPFWVPIWSFNDEEIQRMVEKQLDDYCAKGELAMVALTDDTIGKCFAIRKAHEYSESAVNDWLSLFT
jgi:hypothetical protein